MSAVDYLKKAIEYDINGRKLESLKLYESGISALLVDCKSMLLKNAHFILFYCFWFVNNFQFSFYWFVFFIQFQLNFCFYITDETNSEKKEHFQRKIAEYISRAEQIKEQIREQRSKGEIKDKIHIIANGTGYGYDTIFGKYLGDDVKEISLEEPYLREYYQVCFWFSISEYSRNSFSCQFYSSW